MHSLRVLAVAAAAAVLATVTAAGATAAAPVSVLTFGAPGPGGPNVPLGHILTGNLQPGTQATFSTVPGGPVGTACTVSTSRCRS